MSEYGGQMSQLSGWAMLASLVAMLLALSIPVAAIAYFVSRAPKPQLDEFGLGSVSLHDEMNEFIAAVERGEVTLASLADVSEKHSTTSSPPTRGGSVSQ
ncbi:hypothetical protein [Mycobacterium sp. ENV421]|uniref:hypothetical protein n=1 Tax=Mycobacterium sp. ENV421 TaxID=1213407 RepID=UPI001E543DF6|nr:hypothetical protein [Mycobacterium sp. ENV421]